MARQAGMIRGAAGRQRRRRGGPEPSNCARHDISLCWLRHRREPLCCFLDLLVSYIQDALNLLAQRSGLPKTQRKAAHDPEGPIRSAATIMAPEARGSMKSFKL